MQAALRLNHKQKMDDTSSNDPDMKPNYPWYKRCHPAHLEPESVSQWVSELVSAVNQAVDPVFIASDNLSKPNLLVFWTFEHKSVCKPVPAINKTQLWVVAICLHGRPVGSFHQEDGLHELCCLQSQRCEYIRKMFYHSMSSAIKMKWSLKSTIKIITRYNND